VLGEPSKIGPYWVVRVLGQGGMGRVYQGRTDGGQLVAVKVIRRDLANDPEFRARFAREVAAARQVNGLYTAHVVDADTDGPDPWLATAFIDAPSLEKRVRLGGPLPHSEVRRVAAALAEGLGKIHAAGLVHRDLKPSNILLARDGLRIVDFGIAKQVTPGDTLTHHGVPGTPAYMSPEQARGGKVGFPSDVFSLGVTICFAATGKDPWGPGSAEEILDRVAQEHPGLTGLPADVMALTRRCLAKTPQERPTTAEILTELGDRDPVGELWPAPPRTVPSRPAAVPSPEALDMPGIPGAPTPAPADLHGGGFSGTAERDTSPMSRPPGARRPAGGTPDRAPRRAPSVQTRARRVAAVAAAVAVAAGIGIAAVVKFSPGGPGSAAGNPPTITKPVPVGCPAQFASPKDPELIGFVTSSCFPAGSDMATVASSIDKQNANAISSGTPYRTVVFFGVMSSSIGTANPASLFQLRGILYAQQQQNRADSKYKIRVLLANAADEFKAGQEAAQWISERAQKDHSIVAVLGIGQSRTFALSAIQTLGQENLPVIGTSVTGDLMSAQNFFRVSPSNARQAQLAATFAQRTLKVQKVLVLANQNKDIRGKNYDLYSDDLAAQFGRYFVDSSHKIIEVCDYGEQDLPKVNCGGHPISIPQLRDRICQENPDLIFFAGRASALPQLFTTPGGTCKHLPPVLGSSDVPKYADSTDLQKVVPEYGSQLYYLSFAPAKQSGCRTHAHPFQTEPMCSFLAYYRAQHYSGPSNDADNNAGLSYDSSDAMLGDDALQTVIQVINVTGDPGIDGAGVIRELDSGKISFDGASGRISFSAHDHAPPNHPVYITLLGSTLTLQISCGQFSASNAEEGGSCPAVP
jgi:eukaryotic-like serine/threonine-protein kinase